MFGNVEKEASFEALNDAVIFFKNHAQFLDKNHPQISLANDGEINFFWKKEGLVADLGFYGDGTYSYYIKIHNDEYLKDNAKIDELISKEILDHF